MWLHKVPSVPQDIERIRYPFMTKIATEFSSQLDQSVSVVILVIFVSMFRYPHLESGPPGKPKYPRLKLRPTRWQHRMWSSQPSTQFATRVSCTPGWRSTSHWFCVDLQDLARP